MLRSYTRLKPVSEKRKAMQLARDACCRETLKRAKWRCEAKLPGICAGEAFDTHEICSRAQLGSPIDSNNTLAVCRRCHNHLHTHPADAHALGLLHSEKHAARLAVEGNRLG